MEHSTRWLIWPSKSPNPSGLPKYLGKYFTCKHMHILQGQTQPSEQTIVSHLLLRTPHSQTETDGKRWLSHLDEEVGLATAYPVMVLDTRNQNFLPLLSGTSYKQYFHFKERIIVEYLNHYKMMPEKKGREGGREGRRERQRDQKKKTLKVHKSTRRP